ncbi:hypothetical protein ABIC16_001061 [Sphingomonas sp. PvP055]|uniref:hypothetical protein n=1 Tax=Sphingomonas sp. PvP055 TaxID=3156391 RepID=UPI00339A123E
MTPGPARDAMGHARRRRVSPVAILGSLACLAGCVLAARVTRDEWLAADLVQAVADRSATVRDATLEAYGDRSPAGLPIRAAAPLSQLALNGARSGASPGLRAINAARADRLIRRLARTRPDWDATLLLVTQRELLVHGAATPTALAAFAASYRVRPFHNRAAIWRIAFTRLYWRDLDPATRRAGIAEAVWQTRYDDGQRGAIERLLGDTPAGVAYQLRMAAIGHGAR